MATIYDVFPNDLIEKAAQELKKIDALQPPEWAAFVKTGTHKERPPLNDDWWYYRAAAVLRKVYKMGPIGVSKLRTQYGGKKNMGNSPEHFRRASGNILRKILQQLQKAELIKYKDKGLHKGRIITPKGKSFLDKIASELYKSQERFLTKHAKEEKHEAKKEAEVKKETKTKEEPKKEEVNKEEKKETEVIIESVPSKKETEIKKEEKKAEEKPIGPDTE